MFFKKNLFFIVILVIGLLVIGCTPQAEEAPNEEIEVDKADVAATVDGVNILKEDFENTVNMMVANYEQQGFSFEGEEGEKILEQIRKQAIDSLVQAEVLYQEAEKQGFEVSDEEVVEQFELAKGQFPSEDDFNTALKENNLTEDKVKEMIARDMRIEQFVDKNMESITVTEEEMLDIYNLHKEQVEANPEQSEQPMPAFEEVKSQIEAQIKEQKRQVQFTKMMEELMKTKEIEINI